MGRTFVTFAEAARMLKRSVRTVHTYVKRGLIRREYEDGNVVLLREDVEQLMSEEGVGRQVLNNKTLTDIQGRLRTLETQMAVVRKIHGIEDREPYRPSSDTAQGLAFAVKAALRAQEFASEEVHHWVEVFLRTDEVTLGLMRQTGASAEFWEDLYYLCIHLMEFVSDPKRCKDNRTWYQYHLELTECLKRIRSMALVWIESGKGSAPAALRRQLGGGKDDLIRRLKAPDSN